MFLFKNTRFKVTYSGADPGFPVRIAPTLVGGTPTSDAGAFTYNNVCKNEKIVFSFGQGGHGTGKTGNLAVNFSRQGKHREFSKFNFLHRENCGNTGKIMKI